MFRHGIGPVIFPYLDEKSFDVILAPIGGLPPPHLILRGELSTEPSFISSGAMGSLLSERLLSIFDSGLLLI